MKRWYDKQQLDERQEQILLQIEHRGCWFAFWALLASIFIQSFLYGPGDLEHIAGEWLVFMAGAVSHAFLYKARHLGQKVCTYGKK